MRPIRYAQAGLVLFIAVIGGYALLSPTSATHKDFECLGCNVILISIDTLGATYADVTGGSMPRTAERVGASGAVFTEAFSQAPWTLPSHTAMLTGQYPWDFNVWRAYDKLPDHAQTIAEMLRAYGYDTTTFTNGFFVQPDWGLTQGFTEVYGSKEETAWKDIPKIFTDAEQWLVGRATTTPYFLFIHSFGVHDPYVDESGITYTVQNIATANSDPGEHAKVLEDAYKAGVRRADSALSDFLDALEKRGALSHTVVILTSDHGEEFGQHGSVGVHGITLHRELLHVPLILFTPHVRSPLTIDRTVEIRAIPATILELLTLPTNYTIANSLVPYLKGVDLGDMPVRSATAFTRSELLESVKHGYAGALKKGVSESTATYKDPVQLSLIKGPYHLIRTPVGTELYDMKSDPLEAKNKYRTPETDQTLIDIEKMMQSFYAK